MFKDQDKYDIGDVMFIEFEYLGICKVVIRTVIESKNIFGKKRYTYVVENADKLGRGDYLKVDHDRFVPM